MQLALPDARTVARGRVLIVEDDQDIRDSIADVLRDEGLAAETAAHGSAALALLRRQGEVPPNLILLDLMMPVMNGWEFREELLKDARLAAIPVVVLTGDARPRERAEELDADDAVGKPISIEQLLEVVGRFTGSTTTA